MSGIDAVHAKSHELQVVLVSDSLHPGEHANAAARELHDVATANLSALWERVAQYRNSAWTAQDVITEGAGLPEEMPDPCAREAWWHAQGRAEALAEVMTMLERAGAVGPVLVTVDARANA